MYVTKQTAARPHGALMHDPTISVEGNRFLFIGFQPQGLGHWEHSCLKLCSPTRPSTSLAHHQAISQKMPKRSPYPYLFLSRLHKQFLNLYARYTCGFQSCHRLAEALSFRIWGTLSSASM